MRLMGTGKLHTLATSGDRTLAGAVAALRAELAAAEWADADDAAETYPNARFRGHRIEIALPAGHCAVVAVNYPAMVVLVEFAGRKDDLPPALSRKSRKQA